MLTVHGSLTINSLQNALGEATSESPLDLRGCTFIDPVGLVTVAMAASAGDGRHRTWRAPRNLDTNQYMARMHLPEVLRAVARVEPDTCDPVRERNQRGALLELTHRPSQDVASELGELVLRRLDGAWVDQRVREATWTCVIEAWGNIKDHAEANVGFAAAQVLERDTPRERLVIGIADAGIGIAQSYGESRCGLGDLDAVRLAIGGTSSTSDEDRGLGLSTMKEMAAEELGGKLLVFSGDAGLIATGSSSRVIRAKSHLPGTIIGVELPCGR